MNPDDIKEVDGQLIYQDKAIQIAIKHFHILDLDLPEDTGYMKHLFQAIKSNKTAVLSHENATYASDKTLLGYLYQTRHTMSQFNREFVEKYLPWSSGFDCQDKVVYHGQKFLFNDLLSPRIKDNFVLKIGIGLQGAGVMIGKDASVKQWETAISEAKEKKDGMLQEYLAPDSVELPFVEEEKIIYRVCPFVLGKYVYLGNAAAGNVVRYSKKIDETVINYHQGSHVVVSFVESFH